jgi:hypothetical protein
MQESSFQCARGRYSSVDNTRGAYVTWKAAFLVGLSRPPCYPATPLPGHPSRMHHHYLEGGFLNNDN